MKNRIGNLSLDFFFTIFLQFFIKIQNRRQFKFFARILKTIDNLSTQELYSFNNNL